MKRGDEWMLSKCWLQGQPQTHLLLILIWATALLEALWGSHVDWASSPAFVLLGSAWLPHSTLVHSIWQQNKSIKWLDKCPKSITSEHCSEMILCFVVIIDIKRYLQSFC